MELLTGRIYIIRSPNTEMVYIGSTIQTLKRRLQGHISDLKKEKRTSSYLIVEKGEAYIELLEEVEVESERELERLEQIWIVNTDNAVNKYRAYVTDEERLQKLKDCTRKYREEHKEQLAEKGRIQQRKYQIANKDKVAEIHRKYYEAHKEQLIAKSRKNYEVHKEEKNAKRKVKVLCEICDCYVAKGGISKHKKSVKHIANLEKSS